uniref:N-acetylglucosaminylphosphatidylinositol deacetylase n=1 Tax=Zooxanthella nutricula TaxID=1333877 RepID=A0A7S2HFT7_9DINO
MFFWPTLLQLCAAGADVSVLCLSTGNFDGLGATRKEEMCRSCARLRIGPKNLDILDLDSLQDGFWAWPEDVIAARVREFIRTRGVGLVLTFDGIGVSGHPNHISTSLGVRRACDICAVEGSSSFEVLLLESAPLPWKYFGWLCIWADAFRERADAARCTCRSPLACLRALACHWSQLVWYRVLFTLFSRYAFVNTYVRHVPPTAAPAEPAQEAEDAAPGALRQRRKQ